MLCTYVTTYLPKTHTHTQQELVAYYRTNSLGGSFPGVDTALRFPYKEAVPDVRRARSISNPPPPQLNPPVSPVVSVSSLGTISSTLDRYADVLFTFQAEYPDELSIDVSVAINKVYSRSPGPRK